MPHDCVSWVLKSITEWLNGDSELPDELASHPDFQELFEILVGSDGGVDCEGNPLRSGRSKHKLVPVSTPGKWM